MHKKYLFITIIGLIIFNNTFAQTAIMPNGSGTESDPYEIASLENLYWFSQNADYWSFYYEQTADINASDTYTWNEGNGITPIGNYTTKFTGSYNGKGFSIDSLYINYPDDKYVGLFGYTNGAHIDSLGLNAANISGKINVAALVGYNNSSSISACYSTGIISATYMAGGLVGYNSSSTINGCYTAVDIEATTPNCFAGGLVGYNKSSEINNCYSSGSIDGLYKSGGLVGYNTSSSAISNCYATGSVKDTTKTGGVVGQNASSTLSACYYNSETAGVATGIGEDNKSQTSTGLSTSEMKQETSFDSWDFTETTGVWEIVDGVTFPRLQHIDNVPIILPVPDHVITIDEAYTYALGVIPMDDQTLSYSLAQSAEGMTISETGVLSWTPTEIGEYTIEVVVTDANGLYNSLIFTITVVTFEGSGTEDDPYQIALLSQLEELTQHSILWDLHFEQTANINASETRTWNDSMGLSPIGNETTHFSGSYNGKGFRIDNLFINRPDQEYVGLFGYIKEGRVDSLGLAFSDITGYTKVGALAGYNYTSTITASYSTGSVSATFNVGGLVGESYSLSNIYRCYSTANVTASGTNCTAGGLLGYNLSSAISTCYSTGNINAIGISGGLVGYNASSSTITNCYAAGSVLDTLIAGALVGKNYSSTLTACYYNAETAGVAAGIDDDNNDQTYTALTTSEMKQEAMFISWDFDETTGNWVIEEGVTYPRLRLVDNVPVISPIENQIITINEAYSYPIEVIGMDNQSINYSILQGETGMAVSEDGVLNWTPDQTGVYTIEILATDAIGLYSSASFTVTVVTFSGSGTDSDPYQINSLSQLQELSQQSILWEFCFEQTANIDASETNSWNTDDNTASGFSPIGNSTNYFTGSYNGKGFYIDGLYINYPDDDNIGLFGYTYGANIDSIHLSNYNMTGYHSVGGLIGCAYDSEINECQTSGEAAGYNYVGGLVGYLMENSSITYSYSSASVVGTQSGSGGLVGRTNNANDITNCYATGTISGDSGVGGLVGTNYATNILYCYATGSVSGSSNGVGGLTGFNNSSSSIENSYATGAVSGSSIGVGGLIGQNKSSSTITNCYASGLVTSNSTSAGGLVGYNNATISNSYFNSETTELSVGIGDDENSQSVSSQNDDEMQLSSTFSSWDFTNIWAIRTDSTYPTLLTLNNNAPFAFSDTLYVAGSIDLNTIDTILWNDCDYETNKTSLTYTIVGSPYYGSITNDTYNFYSGASKNDVDTVIYRVGEMLPSGDTLWGNQAYLFMINTDNVAPVLTAVNDTAMDENTSLTFTMNDVTGSDANESDVLTPLVVEGDNYTADGSTLTPTADYYGLLTVGITLSDGELHSDTLYITVTVRQAPDITTITWNSPDAVTYGTAIGSEVMNATAGEAEGSFSYSFTADSIFDAGTYELVVNFTPNNSSDYTSANATVNYTVNQKELIITADDQSINAGEDIPPLTYTYSGFVNGEDESVLDILPTITTSASTISDAGEYFITIYGGSDNNYLFSYVSGILTVIGSSPIQDENEVSSFKVYPNPATTYLLVEGEEGMAYIYSVNGALQLIHNLEVSHTIDISALAKGIYILRINDKNIKILKN